MHSETVKTLVMGKREVINLEANFEKDTGWFEGIPASSFFLRFSQLSQIERNFWKSDIQSFL